jgi:cell division inhibitor SepF
MAITMSNYAEAEDFDAPQTRDGFFARIKRSFMGHEEWDDEEDDIRENASASHSASASVRGATPVISLSRRSNGLRLEQSKRAHVTVRRSVQNFDDARRAADGLKDGQQQIVNLEQTPADMAERIIDFLNGATYALDGSVEKIGEQVYLFTPSSVTIDVEEKPMPGSRPSFLDRG